MTNTEGDWLGERAQTALALAYVRAIARGMGLWERFLFWVAFRIPFRVIPRRDGRGAYLYRGTLLPRTRFTRPRYLHFFFSGDSENELHTHPWSARSRILAGGYIEERWDDAADARVCYWRAPGDRVTLRADTAHRVLLRNGRGAWTLITPGRRVDAPRAESWGFWNPEQSWYLDQASYKALKRGNDGHA